MYKTIVVHVDGSPEQEGRLRVGALLANAFDAHLVGSAATGISWFDYSLLVGSMGAPMMPESDFSGVREAVEARLQEFSTAVGRHGVNSFETRMLEDDARYALLLESRYADLVIVSRDAEPIVVPGIPAQARGLPEYIALHGARPVLVVPPGWKGRLLPGTAVVGWDGSMQAIRAISAALPLLRQADAVKLTLINPGVMAEMHGEEPGADMALHLARHGVKVDVVIETTRSSTGEALLKVAREHDAGLLVTGAFGHSRYREFVLGGVTRSLLAGSTTPLLIAH
ncbi:universal stress protein [Massilia sp. CFBP9012]|uniref:universal stress protein n=1 Tax=Massilia sp. CFBP9012 TaxID=3096531 RepID=UPI002A6A8666|nr:universal stress protein [Massilia sp. CFBP9012]MDY0977121.1 universal stress protein [Massilia sp. CFBP9012]